MSLPEPVIAASIERRFRATHALPGIGVAQPHGHDYQVRAGFAKPVALARGCTWPLGEMERQLELVIARVSGKDLNTALPFPPTVEILACWLLANLGFPWEFVEIFAYGNYRVRVEQQQLSAELVSALRAGAAS